MAFVVMIFILGLVVGSFLNCIIFRLETGRSFLKGRSFCPDCHHYLGFWDLIPLFSFLFLKGRCRYCQKKISWQYPLVEIATALTFLAILNYHLSIFYFLISAFLIVIFVYDLKHYLIIDKVIYPAIAIAVIYHLLRSNLETERFDLGVLWAALGAAAFFGAVVLISRGKWMGAGDIKLAFLMGLLLGWPKILPALFFAFFLGAIIGIGLIILGKKKLSSQVPFGPFLVSGTFFALFLGQEVIDWYSNLCTKGLL